MTEHKDKPIFIDQSQIQVYKRCQRLWWFKYVRKLRRQTDFASLPGTGTLVHAGLEAYYNGKLEHPGEWIRAKADQMIELEPQSEERIRKSAELAGVMIDGYMDWLADTGSDAGLELIDAERYVRVELKQPGEKKIFLQGFIDAFVRREIDGSVSQLEHKTTSSTADDRTAQGNFQLLTYNLIAYLQFLEDQQRGMPVARNDGMIVNWLRRVYRDQRSKPPFYGRYDVRHNKEELRSHWKHVVSITLEMESKRARLAAGEDPHMVCQPSWGQCCGSRIGGNEFTPLCQMMDNGSAAEDMIRDFYTTEKRRKVPVVISNRWEKEQEEGNE